MTIPLCIELDSAVLKSKRIDIYLDADRCGHTKGDIDVFDNLLVSPDVLSTSKDLPVSDNLSEGPTRLLLTIFLKRRSSIANGNVSHGIYD